MAVRSKVLGGGSFSDAAEHTIYTAPAGYTGVCKGLTIGFPSLPAPNVAIWHVGSGLGVVLLFAYPSAFVGSVPLTANSPLWEVLEPGDYLYAQGDGTGAYTVLAAGAELMGVAP